MSATLQGLKKEAETFLNQVITVDETWIHSGILCIMSTKQTNNEGLDLTDASENVAQDYAYIGQK